MKEIICSGGSNTSYRNADKNVFYQGIGGLNQNYGTNSFPEVIHNLYGNKIYNLAVAGNSVEPAVLSIISFATKLIKEGNSNFSIILNCPDFYRPSVYFSKETLHRKGIYKRMGSPVPNSYLFTDDMSGFYLFGGIHNVNENSFENKQIYKIAESISNHTFSHEHSEIRALTHLLLLQNFCKANNIQYKIFFDFDVFSKPFSPFFQLNKTNVETYFKSFFIDKTFPQKELLGNINYDPYVFDLFNLLDTEHIWFFEDDNLKYGGIHEWIFKNNEYKEGDTEYTALYVEDISQSFGHENTTDIVVKMTIESAKNKMKEGIFFDTGHPTYYYWEKFVKEVMVNWNLF
jgi:hypothetical protein